MIPPFGCAMTRSFGLDPSNNTLPLRRCRPTPCSTWPISVLERYPGLNLFGCEGAANHQMDSYLFRKQNAVFLFVQVISSNVRVRKDPGLSYQHFISRAPHACPLLSLKCWTVLSAWSERSKNFFNLDQVVWTVCIRQLGTFEVSLH